MKIVSMMAASIMIFCLSTFAVAQQPDLVFKAVSSQVLHDMIKQEQPDLIIIDTRSTGEYEEAHVKGAINIPWAVLEKEPTQLKKFPYQSSLVFYCTGLA